MMYTVYMDDEVLHYQGDEKYIINNAVLTEKINEASTFEFDIYETNPKYNHFEIGKNYISIERDGKEIFYGRVMEISVDINNTKHVYARGILAELYNLISTTGGAYNISDLGEALLSKLIPYTGPTSCPSPGGKKMWLRIRGDQIQGITYYLVKRDKTTGKYLRSAPFATFNNFTPIIDSSEVRILITSSNPTAEYHQGFFKVLEWKYTDEAESINYWEEQSQDLDSLYGVPITYIDPLDCKSDYTPWSYGRYINLAPTLLISFNSDYVNIGGGNLDLEGIKSNLDELKERYTDKYGLYMKLTKQEGKHIYNLGVYTKNDYGETSNQVIEKGRNLISFKMTENAESIINVARVKGKILSETGSTDIDIVGTSESTYHTFSNNDRIEVWDSINRYGRYETFLEFDDILSKEDLKNRATDWVLNHAYPELDVEASAFDLSYLNSDLDSFEVGDKAKIIGEPFGIDDMYAFITEKTTYINDLSKNQIRLGGTQKTYTKQVSNTFSINNM